MAVHHGIKVEVFTDDGLLPIYEDPDAADRLVSDPPKFYIEAVNGKLFGIFVSLTRDFSFRGCDMVRVMMSLDGSKSHCVLAQKRDWENHPERPVARFQELREYDPVKKKWYKSSLTFGPITTNEDVRTHLLPTEVEHLGTVSIAVQAVIRMKRSDNERRSVQAQRSREVHTPLAEIPEKALKGRAISNTINLVRNKVIEPPESSKCRYIPVKGRHDHRQGIHILYRSRSALGVLGCILREPSESCETSCAPLSSARATTQKVALAAPFPDPAQEIADLRARLAVLEKTLNVDSSEPERKVKHEHPDEDGKKSNKRQKATGHIETIDLTED